MNKSAVHQNLNTSDITYYKNLIKSVDYLKNEIESMQTKPLDKELLVTPLSRDVRNVENSKRVIRKTDKGALVSGVLKNSKLTEAEIIGIDNEAPEYIKSRYVQLVNGAKPTKTPVGLKKVVSVPRSEVVKLFTKGYNDTYTKLVESNKNHSTKDVLAQMSKNDFLGNLATQM